MNLKNIAYKALALVVSRKFLTALASILVVFKVIPESAEGAVVESILTIAVAVSYILSVALEDGLRASRQV